MPKSLMLVFSNPTSAAQEAEYNEWYTSKHLPEVCAIPGIAAATRYKLDKSVPLMPGIDPDPRAYLAVYELEAKDSEGLLALVESMKLALAEGRADISPAIDGTTASVSFAMPITTRLVALA